MQCVVSMPNNCKEDEVPLPFSVNWNSPWGSYLLLVCSLSLVLQLRCGFFSVGDNLDLVLGVVLLTVALSRRGAEQLAGREDPGLGK